LLTPASELRELTEKLQRDTDDLQSAAEAAQPNQET
jgi:hypothetical protein